MNSILKLKDQVEYILRDHPHTRNDDTDLMVQLWVTYYPHALERNMHNQLRVPIGALKHIPQLDAISRCRRKIQEEKYLPTQEDVVIKRKMNIDVWKASMGYNGGMVSNSKGFMDGEHIVLY